MISESTVPISLMSQHKPAAGQRGSLDSAQLWIGQDADCFCLPAIAQSDVRQLGLVQRNKSWQNHLRNGISDGPAGLLLVKTWGFIDWILVEDARESSCEITSRPVNTLSAEFSDSIWGAVSALRVSANITRPILWSVKASLTWHDDTVSEKNSPASSKSRLSSKDFLQLGKKQPHGSFYYQFIITCHSNNVVDVVATAGIIAKIPNHTSKDRQIQLLVGKKGWVLSRICAQNSQHIFFLQHSWVVLFPERVQKTFYLWPRQQKPLRCLLIVSTIRFTSKQLL